MAEKAKVGRTITAHEYPLAKIFSDDYAFTIPGYQRPYSWGTEQAGELLDDLLAALAGTQGPIEAIDPYFLGSIVLIKGETADAEVVDGQQRLTTLTILLSAIRAAADKSDATHLTPFICEKGNPFSGTQDRFRLRLRERDQPFFQEHIQEDDGLSILVGLNAALTDSRRAIRENALLFSGKLQKLDPSTRLRLGQFALMRCFLVVVATPDLDSAFRIFSVLNNRGLDLAATDIIKARIVGAISETARDTYTARWEEIEEKLGRDAFNDLFGHIRMIYRRSKPKGTLTKEFEDHVMVNRTPSGFIDDVLMPFSEAFQDIRDQGYESAQDASAVNTRFYWLAKVDSSDWLPPAILFLARYRQNPPELEWFFGRLERLAYGLMILRADVNERMRRFSDVTEWVDKGKDLRAVDSPLALTAAEQNDIVRMLDGNFYDQLKVRLPVLLRLDSILSDGSASYELPVLTIEHVLPQTPTADSEWITWFPDAAERERWTDRLGNLVLLSRKKNSQAQNFEFARKKTEYFQRKKGSPFVLTSQVLNETSWGPDVLAKRQKDLLQALQTHWGLSAGR